jgi:Transposase DDE domain
MRLVAVRWGKRPVVFLFSTDPDLTAVEIVTAYCTRFAIETGFRDAKQNFGLSTYQVRRRQSIVRLVHLCLWAQTLLRLRFWQQRPVAVWGDWRKPLSYLTLRQEKELAKQADGIVPIAAISGASPSAEPNPKKSSAEAPPI